jgi:hypothetical protein
MRLSSALAVAVSIVIITSGNSDASVRAQQWKTASPPRWLSPPSAAAAITGIPQYYEGILADRLCVDSRIASDGSDMLIGPQEHTVSCLLMPPCVDSGFTLLQMLPSNGQWYPVHNFSTATTLAFVSWIKSKGFAPSRRNKYIRFAAIWTPTTQASRPFDMTIDFSTVVMYLNDLPATARNRNCVPTTAFTKCLDASPFVAGDATSTGNPTTGAANCRMLAAQWRLCIDTLSATCSSSFATQLGIIQRSRLCTPRALELGASSTANFNYAVDADVAANAVCSDGNVGRDAVCQIAVDVAGGPAATSSAAVVIPRTSLTAIAVMVAAIFLLETMTL